MNLTLIAVVILSGVTHGCASMDSPEYELTPELSATAESNAADELNIVESVLGDQEFDGFCHDDIFAKYLASEFKQEAGKGRSRAREADAEIRYKSRLVLEGDVVPRNRALPLVMNPQVEYWVNYFKGNGRKDFIRWLERSQNLKDRLISLIREEGLPEEIFYLAMIESGLNPRAFSRARAMGPWQFMSGTAKIYGLRIDFWVDERRNIEKSTIAAARYLRDMYARFGDWWLAMAAYNAGPGKISGALRKARTRDYWELARTRYIRPETKHYVPKVFAAAILASNPEAYGFHITPNQDLQIQMAIVELTRPVLLTDIASALGVSVQQIREWNPELIGEITPPPGKHKLNYRFQVPFELSQTLVAAIPNLKDLQIADIKLYRVRSGDTLIGIARKHGLSVTSIKQINPGLDARRMRVGRQVALPLPDIRIM